MDLKQVIADEQYEALKSVFLASGKGRRPNLPTDISITNHLLVQLFFLREEGQKSWREVECWFTKILPTVSSSRVRNLVETATKKCKLLQPIDVNTFLAAQLDINFISASLSALGIDRSNVLTSFKLEANRITNRVVVDLDLFRSQEGLPKTFLTDSLARLFDMDKRVIAPAINCALKSYQCHRKKGTAQNTALDEFLGLRFEPAHTKQSSVSTEPATSGIPHPSIRAASTQTVHHSPAEFTALTENIQHLKAVISDLQKEKAKAFSVPSCRCEHQTVTIKDSELEVRRVKKSAKLRVANLKRDLKLKRESVVSVQKRCSDLKKNLEKAKFQNKDLKDDLEYYKFETARLSALLEDQDTFNIALKNPTKNTYTDDVRRTIITLVSEAGVSASKVSNVIKTVSEILFHKKFEDDLPCTQTAINMCDEAFVLSNIQVAESMLNTNFCTLHSDGTSRDGKKIVGKQVSLSDGSQLYLGYAPVATEDAATLLDITLYMFKRLADCYNSVSDGNLDSEAILRELLSKVKSTMTDRAAVMKCFGKKFEDFLNTEMGIDTQVHFLHCNAHFLLAVSTSCDKALAAVEKEAGETLGRDKDAKFSHFVSDSETATVRLIRLACDIFGPRGDEKNGCRGDWLAFCPNSFIPSFRANRFNCFFEAAAALIYHRSDIVRFFSSGVLPESINLKLQSVYLDIKDDSLMCYICAIALFFLKVTEPYWRLINSKTVLYVEFCQYVKMLYSCLTVWSTDPSQLVDRSFSCVFGDAFVQTSSPYYHPVHDFLSSCDDSLVSQVISACSSETLVATERQLSDFLGDGPFASQRAHDEATLEQLRHCPLTNLIGESAFGDFDFDCSKRRNASLHNRSSIHTVNRNKTMKYMSSKSVTQRQKMFSVARNIAPKLRKENRENEEAVQLAKKQKFAENQQRKIEKQISELERHTKLHENIYKIGGPCKTSHELDALLTKLTSEGMSKTQITEAFKDQVRFQKTVLGKKGLKLGTLDFMIDSLKSVLTD